MTWIGNDAAALRGYLQDLDALDRDEILWVDFSSPEAQPAWELQVQTSMRREPHWKKVRCVIPAASVDGIDWFSLYSSLSLLVQACRRSGADLSLLELSGNAEDDRRIQLLFAYDTLTGDTHPAASRHFDAKIIAFTPERLRVRSTCRAARDCLVGAREVESADSAGSPAEQLSWRRDFLGVYNTRFEDAVGELDQACAPERFGISRRRFRRRYGPLPGIDAFIELRQSLPCTDNVCLGSGPRPESNAFFFRDPVNPFEKLLADINCFAADLHLYYGTTAVGIDRFQIPEMETRPHPETDDAATLSDAVAAHLQTPLWRENSRVINDLTHQLTLVTADANALATAAAFDQRRRIRRRLTQRMEDVISSFSQAADAEAAALQARLALPPATDTACRSTPALLREPPYLFSVAYNLLNHRFLQPFCTAPQMENGPQPNETMPGANTLGLWVALWGCRHFFIHLPGFLPAPFFRRSRLAGLAVDLLLAIMRLLDIYQFVCAH